MKTILVLLPAACFFIFGGALNFSLADDDEHEERGYYHKNSDRDDDDDNHRHRYRNRKRHRRHEHDGIYLIPATNPTYKEECGACHFAYQPELLPSASWVKILDQLDDHFGEEIELDPDAGKIISDYLSANGAEKSSAKGAVKIMRSLGRGRPLRITDIPYIRKKHHELNPDVLKRESIGSLSNCAACHKTAEQGIYDEDNVGIPPGGAVKK